MMTAKITYRAKKEPATKMMSALAKYQLMIGSKNRKLTQI
jgi:hypothetical protein